MCIHAYLWAVMFICTILIVAMIEYKAKVQELHDEVKGQQHPIDPIQHDQDEEKEKDSSKPLKMGIHNCQLQDLKGGIKKTLITNTNSNDHETIRRIIQNINSTIQDMETKIQNLEKQDLKLSVIVERKVHELNSFDERVDSKVQKLDSGVQSIDSNIDKIKADVKKLDRRLQKFMANCTSKKNSAIAHGSLLSVTVIIVTALDCLFFL